MTRLTDDLPVGVLGATGQQGGAVVDALLDGGHAVRAIVRDVSSRRSSTLAARGVDVVTGDQDEPDSLLEPLSGLSALFLMTTFTDDSGTDGEIRRGTGVADAAVRAGVPRVVYSSVGGAERNSGVPHFESKWQIEQYLTPLLPTLVVRPVYFMDNLADQLGKGSEDETVVRMPMPGNVALQMVAVRDIGIVAAAALTDPDALGGPSLEIAGDELTGEQIAQRVGARAGRTGRYEELPLDALGDDEDLKSMFRWFVETPAYDADFDRTKAIDAGVLDLARWLADR